MFKVTYTAQEEFGPSSQTEILGVFMTREEAQKCAADSGLKCRVSAYKMTPAEERRAKLMASFGQKYIPAVAR